MSITLTGLVRQVSSTARRKYVASSFRRSAWKNNAFLRAKLARYLQYAVLAIASGSWGKPQGLAAKILGGRVPTDTLMV
jgi:hypothetical protein